MPHYNNTTIYLSHFHLLFIGFMYILILSLQSDKYDCNLIRHTELNVTEYHDFIYVKVAVKFVYISFLEHIKQKIMRYFIFIRIIMIQLKASSAKHLTSLTRNLNISPKVSSK